MIERDPPFFYDVACDVCSAGEERVEAESFQETVREIKELGWSIFKSGNEWVHQCPDCQGRS